VIILNLPEQVVSLVSFEIDMENYWYTLRSKPRKEDIVWRQTLSYGYEAFYPRIRVHPVNPRSRRIKPYFPGYLFIHVDLEHVGTSVFNWMPHTLGLVSFGGEPAIVPEHLISAIDQRVKEINATGGEVLASLHSGDSIWITSGPFQGYEAIFDAQVSGSERVRVLLEFLGNHRKVTVTLDASNITKAGSKKKRK